MPDLAALDLEADDAGALDRDDEVDLVVLEVVGDALAGDDEVVGLELFGQRLVDAALGAVGEAWGFGRGDRHGLAAVDAVQPEPHIEPSPLGALASCDVDDVIEGPAVLGGDRGEDFEDVGGFFDDGIAGGCRNELGDLLAQLIEQSGPVFGRAQRPHMRGVRPGCADDVGDLVPNEFAHAVPPPRDNAVVQLYRSALTSGVRRGQ